MKQGIDFAYGNLPAQKFKDLGYDFVCRYVSIPGSAKNITKAELAKYMNAHIEVVFVFEIDARRAMMGATQGKNDAQSAYNQLKGLGVSLPTPIYFAVDFDASPGNQGAINAYLGGAASLLGWQNTGVYGGYYVVKRALDAGVCKYGWQTYAWSGGQWDKRAHIQQYKNGVVVLGVSCDLDRSSVTDYGQYPRPIIPTPVPPIPKPWWTKYGPKRKPKWFFKALKRYQQLLKKKPKGKAPTP